MNLTITIYNSNDDSRVISKSLAQYVPATTCQYVGMGPDISVLNPRVKLFLDMATYPNIFTCTHFSIAEFGRTYYINSISIVEGGALEISGEVDVLYSYRTTIKSASGYVSRSENLFEPSLYDDRIPQIGGSNIHETMYQAIPGYNATGCYVVRVKGSGATITNSFVLTYSELTSLSEHVWVDGTNFSEYVQSVMWLPISYAYLSADAITADIYLGVHKVLDDKPLIYANKVSLGNVLNPLRLFPLNYGGDFRDYDARWTTCYIEYCNSRYQVDANEFKYLIKFDTSLDPITGDMALRLYRVDGDNEYIILATTKRIGVDISVNGDSSINFLGLGADALGAIASAANGNFLQSTGAIGNMVNVNHYIHSQEIGTNGSKAEAQFIGKIGVQVERVISGELAEHHNGRPLMEYADLADLVGYAEVLHITLSGFRATKDEKDRILALLSGGVFF